MNEELLGKWLTIKEWSEIVGYCRSQLRVLLYRSEFSQYRKDNKPTTLLYCPETLGLFHEILKQRYKKSGRKRKSSLLT